MMKLPEEITVIVNKTSDGLWAKVKEFPHCYTQANSYSELVPMLNDSIYSYFGVPKKERGKFLYIPKTLVEELKRKEWEKFFEQLKRKQSLKGKVSEKYTIANRM